MSMWGAWCTWSWERSKLFKSEELKGASEVLLWHCKIYEISKLYKELGWKYLYATRRDLYVISQGTKATTALPIKQEAGLFKYEKYW